jgi:hypothetical protein
MEAAMTTTPPRPGYNPPPSTEEPLIKEPQPRERRPLGQGRRVLFLVLAAVAAVAVLIFLAW